MQLVSIAHYKLIGRVSIDFLDTTDLNTDRVYVEIRERAEYPGGYPGIIFTIPKEDKDRWDKAMKAFNELMEANYGIDA